MKYREYGSTSSRYKRVLYVPNGITLTETTAIAAAIASVGYSIDFKGLSVTSSVVNMSVQAGRNEVWVETRRLSDLDAAVDASFLRILEHNHSAEARCSDCYACCSTSDTWLEIPQRSTSCQFTQRRTPSPHFVRKKVLDDPLFLGEKPRQ